MANNYFQFKEFTVFQSSCAMKVTTDACLFGAWVAKIVEKEISLNNHSRILDIGTGTGLLSMMLAQKSSGIIDAVEIDVEAFRQAANNFENSSWNNRLTVFNHDVKKYQLENSLPYNFILTNPPFFENDLKSYSTKRNLAMHCEALGLDELLESIKRLLSSDGFFAILLPYHRSIYFEDLASTNGFYLAEKVLVKQTSSHSPFRAMLLFGNKTKEIVEREIIIKEGNIYTDAFISLLKDYYLYL
jgi:tRNA1Val (adenine37-N6)-methyltransferase